MSKYIQGLEREANVRVCIYHNDGEYEYVMKESIFDEMKQVAKTKADMIKWLDERKDVIAVDLSVDIR